MELDENVVTLEGHVKALIEFESFCDDREENDEIVVAFEAQVQDLKKSQENLLNQAQLLKANNVMYHKTILKHLSVLIDSNNKFIFITCASLLLV